jgi:thymidine kinase
MGSSKTANALMTRFNYMEKGCEVLLLKPATDVRDDEFDESGKRITKIKSRIGLDAIAEVVGENDSIIYILKRHQETQEINVIVVDEAQFLTPGQCAELRQIASYMDIPCLCFGLRTDFQTNLFPGSARLMALADSISEVKHICSCMDKSIVNARILNGKIVVDGDQIDIGGNDKYEAMCWRCWNDKIMAQNSHK